MSDYKLNIDPVIYDLALESKEVQIALSRTGGQGSRGNSVTNVYLSVDNHLILEISDINGTLVETIDAGDIDTNYSVPNTVPWDTAFGWGDHSTAGYLLTANFSSTFDIDFDAKDTDDLSEGVSNVYFTPVRATESVALISKDLTGIADATQSSLSFVEGTRVLTWEIPVSATVHLSGVPYILTSDKTLVITNANGGRYIRYNTITSELEELSIGSFPDFAADILVAYIYWDAAASCAIIMGDERHSSARDTTFHTWAHLTEGMVWNRGGALTFVLNDDTAEGIELSTPIRVADEDLVHYISHSATPSAPYEQKLQGTVEIPVVWYKGSESHSQILPVPLDSVWPYGPGGRAYYNVIDPELDTGVLTEVDNNNYVNYFVIATNDQRYPIKLLMGQAEYITLAAALDEEWVNYGLNVPELVGMHRVTLHVRPDNSNPASVDIAQVTQISKKTIAASGESAFPISAHGNLTGRTDPDQHNIASITGLQSELDGKASLSAGIQTGGGALIASKVNWITDSLTYILPSASTVAAGTFIVVEKGETYKAQTPTISRTNTDVIRSSGGIAATLQLSTIAATQVRFVSNGVNEWII